MADYNRNPNGIGGYRPGQVGNPGGRPRSASAIQLLALRYCREAVELAAKIMREGTKEDAVRLQAVREILDRGVGKPIATMNLDLVMEKRLQDMTTEELLEFRTKYAALTTASPLLLDAMIKEEEPQLALDPEGNGDGR